MRRRLIWLGLAITSLVVVSYTVPLALLVRQQAAEAAQLEAEREAQQLAALVALSAALSEDLDSKILGETLPPLKAGQMVVLPDGTRVGDPAEPQGDLTAAAVEQEATIADYVEGGWELAIPVVLSDGTAVVSVYVSSATLTEGVAAAWLLLGLLGLVIVGAAVFIADRFGERLVRPISELAGAARNLGEGDLAVRVSISDPDEIAELGRTFNWLAGRLDQLLIEEREHVADLSHGLRTPLTAVRLQADQIRDADDRLALIRQIDRLEEDIDQVIEKARGDRAQRVGSCDAVEVVLARAGFWDVLAEDQKRGFDVEIEPSPIEVNLPADSLEHIVDLLVGNVFTHTPPGTSFSIGVQDEGETAVLIVEDTGPGWPSADVMHRGVSRSGSTGLGLDIVRKSAELSGGSLELDDRPGGGAVVRVRLGLTG